MLQSTYELNYPAKKGQYRLELPIDNHWDRANQRVLLILETVDSQDLRSGTLLSNRSRTVVQNLLSYCQKQVKKHGHPRGQAFAVLNFNNVKFLDQAKELWPSYRASFAKRVQAGIKQLDPTNVIIFGERAAKAMMPHIEHLEWKRGWVLDEVLGGKKRKVTVSLDLENLYNASRDAQDEEEDDAEDGEGDRDTFGKANLLFYVTRNVVNNLCNRHLFDLSYIKPNYKYVDTLDKFKELYAKLKEAECVAVDTETANLTSTCNAIGTIQFAFSTKRGYVLPIDHEQTPFSAEERKFIKKKLRNFFFAKPGVLPLKYLITQYGMFDLRVLREELNMPLIFHDVWEITAAEWLLDENGKYLKDFGVKKVGGLEYIFCSYGNDHYITADFKKDDRSNTALTKLDNKGFLEYGSMDVQSIMGIHKMQRLRASFLDIGDEPYSVAYERLVLKQKSNTAHVISHMVQLGNTIDKLYLAKLKGNESPLLALQDKYRKELNETSEVKKANKIVVRESSTGGGSKGLFNKQPWAFSWTKGGHKIALFFTVMGMKPLTTTPTGLPQVDKRFIEHYSHDNVIVQKYGQLSKLAKLYGTYVKGWWTKLKANPDSAKDNCLRPNYGFFDVVTGRLNSFDPSLQQVPVRSEESKYIKRSFVAPVGYLQIKFDYSAHEVRVWAWSGKDKILAGVFRIGQRLRQLYRVKPSAWLKARIKQQGDIHIINVKFFFGLDVDKEHPLRDAIKKVIFGVIYGKGAKTLARDIGADKTRLKREIDELKKDSSKEARQKLKAAEGRLKEAEERSTKEFAQTLIEKLFSKFRKAGEWLNWAVKQSEEHYYVYSILGMRRNLFGMMTGLKSLMGAMGRRAKNSPIQGTASQVGVTAARLIALELYKALEELELLDKKAKYLPTEPRKAVHDALYSETPYKFVLIYLHIVQYVATYGVTEYYAKEFDCRFPIEPEIEIEIGASEDKHFKWDWSEANLEECLKKALTSQKEIGFLKDTVDEAYEQIMWAYKDKRVKKYLDTKYPILGVTKEMRAELIEEVDAMEAEIKKEETLANKTTNTKKEKV